MSIRPVRPGGDRLTGSCGHHCGIRSAADEGGLTFIGHCPCDECTCIWAVVEVVVDEAQPPGEVRLVSGNSEVTMINVAGRPMCWGWYERSGGVRPWERLADGGTMEACTPASGSAG